MTEHRSRPAHYRRLPACAPESRPAEAHGLRVVFLDQLVHVFDKIIKVCDHHTAIQAPSSGRTVALHCFPDQPGISDRIDPVPRIAEARVLFDVNESAVVT